MFVAAGLLALGAFFFWALQPNVDDYEDFMPEDTKPVRVGGLREGGSHRQGPSHTAAGAVDAVLDAAAITQAVVRDTSYRWGLAFVSIPVSGTLWMVAMVVMDSVEGCSGRTQGLQLQISSAPVPRVPVLPKETTGHCSAPLQCPILTACEREAGDASGCHCQYNLNFFCWLPFRWPRFGVVRVVVHFFFCSQEAATRRRSGELTLQQKVQQYHKTHARDRRVSKSSRAWQWDSYALCGFPLTVVAGRFSFLKP